MTVHYLPIQPKYLHYIRTGQKKVEARVKDKTTEAIKVGDKILFQTPAGDKVECTVFRRSEYANEDDMIESEGLTNIFPDITNLSERVAVRTMEYEEGNPPPTPIMVAFVLKL
uniref:ASCH domain-containing protein n=1 Tax=Acrobeloides nanus TaxID=290746 RepID=A0A914C8L1_9BILA